MIAREHIYIITRYILRASPPQNDPTTTRAAHLKLPRFLAETGRKKGERCLNIILWGAELLLCKPPGTTQFKTEICTSAKL